MGSPDKTILKATGQQSVASMVDEGLSPSWIRQARVVLSLVFQAAVRDGLIARDVTHKVK